MTATTITSPQQSTVLAQLGGTAAAAKPATDESQDRFMTLLVAQLKNQDPLNPMDNAQVTTQLAQIDTVKGIDQLNKTVKKLLGNADAGQALQAAGLVNRMALVPGNSMALEAGSGIGGFDLAADAEAVSVSITDPSGRVIHNANLGPMKSGVHSFAWDGVTDAGVPAQPGAYTFNVKAQIGGKSSSVDSLTATRIEGVVPAEGGPQLQTRNAGLIPMGQVRQIM